MFLETTISEIDKKNGYYLPVNTTPTVVLNVRKTSDITSYKTGTRFSFIGSDDRRNGRIKATCSTAVIDFIAKFDVAPTGNIITVSYFPKDDITKTALSVSIPVDNILIMFAHTNSLYSWLIYEFGNDIKKIVINDTVENVFDDLMPITYGLLYNWYAVNTGLLAPTGWHVPTGTEMSTLITFLGGTAVAGGKVKQVGFAYWNSPNTGADNTSGFYARGAGWRNGFGGAFNNIKIVGIFGASTLFAAAWQEMQLSNTVASLTLATAGMLTHGLSIRCIRDSAVGWNSGDTVSDYDGNVYNTILIGTQIWTVQNLATTHYNDGTLILEVTDSTAWGALLTGARCYYDNDPIYK